MLIQKEGRKTTWSLGLDFASSGSRGTCFSQLREAEVRKLVTAFWELGKADQDSLVAQLLI